ncbi:hypothetical protein D6745_01100 [Candidatus Woesearchaeota archaeon]|nr:MAG: hypothetical protein D6745_01100 [Candidatus Woesearchaeota archaeon]
MGIHLEEYRPPDERPKPRRLFNKVSLLLIFLIVGLSLAFFVRPGITGHVSAINSVVRIGENLTGNMTFTLENPENKTINISSIKVSGKVIGNGSVNIFLEDQNKKRYLIYTNKPGKTGFGSITGFSVLSVTGSTDDLKIDLTKASVSPDNKVVSGIEITNLDTTKAVSIDKIRVSWTPDNGEKLEAVVFENEFKFWDYTGITETVGKQGSGSMIEGVDYRLKKDGSVKIDKLAFDKNMLGKKLTIEIFFRIYMSQFILGDEKSITIQIPITKDLGSVAEEKGKELIEKKEADYLDVFASKSFLSPDFTKIENLIIENTNDAKKIGIDKIKVFWETYNGELIEEIIIGGKVFWKYESVGKPFAKQPRGVTLDGEDFNLDAGSVYIVDSIRFDSVMNEKKFRLEFIMNDGSVKVKEFAVKTKKETNETKVTTTDNETVLGSGIGKSTGEALPAGPKGYIPPNPKQNLIKEIISPAGRVTGNVVFRMDSYVPPITPVESVASGGHAPAGSGTAESGGTGSSGRKSQNKIPAIGKQIQELPELANKPKEVDVACVDTCEFPEPLRQTSYKIIFNIDYGTIFHLDKIIYY